MNGGWKTPRVSVIVPCYNTATYVTATLESLFAQTYRDYEVLVVNDGSPDTHELERALAPWTDKIVYIKTENQGIGGARNSGIRASKSEFIALLDSDDIWEPNYLEVQVRKLDEDPSADIVFPRCQSFREDKLRGPVSPVCRGEVTFISVVQKNGYVMGSILARRSMFQRVGMFDSSLRTGEDYDMWLRCLKGGSRIIYHNEVLLRYRRRPGSLTTDPVRTCTDALKVLTKMRTAVRMTIEEREALERAIRESEGQKLFEEGKCAFIAGDFLSAVEYLGHANTFLHNSRLQLILFLLRRMPKTARYVYLWVSSERERATKMSRRFL